MVTRQAEQRFSLRGPGTSRRDWIVVSLAWIGILEPARVARAWTPWAAEIESDATFKLQEALNAAREGAVIDLADNVLRLTPKGESHFYFGNLTRYLVYPATVLTTSNVTFRNGTLRIVSREGVTANDVQPAIATPKFLIPGSLRNISFEGTTIDTANDGDAINSNQRGVYLVGVNGVRFSKTKARSSGARRGYFAHLQNCENVTISGHRHRNVTGGFNFRYCRGVTFSDCEFDDFSEAIDFDGVNWDASLDKLTFRSSSRRSQCLDLNSLVNFSISNVQVENVGNIANASYKYTTPPEFREYVDGVQPRFLTPTAKGTIRAVTGARIGTNRVPSFLIGNDWAGSPHDGYEPVSDLLIQDVDLTDLSWIQVWEATRLTLRNIVLRDLFTPASGVAGINMQSAAGSDAKLGFSDLDVTIENVQILGCDRGAVSCARPSKLKVKRLKVRDAGRSDEAASDLRISGLEYRAAAVALNGLDIDSAFIQGNSVAIPSWIAATSYPRNGVVRHGGAYFQCVRAGVSGKGPTGSGSSIVDGSVVWRSLDGPYSIIWGADNQVSRLTLAGDAGKYVKGQTLSVQCGDVAGTEPVQVELFAATRRTFIARAVYHWNNGLPRGGNARLVFTMKLIRDGRATVVGRSDTGKSAVGATHLDAGLLDAASGPMLQAADRLVLEVAPVGNAPQLRASIAKLELLPC